MYREHSRFVALAAMWIVGLLWVPIAMSSNEGGKSETLVARSRLDYYTSEKTAEVLVGVPKSAESKALAVNVRHGGKLLVKGHAIGSRRPVIVAFPLEGLSQGDTELACELVQRNNRADLRMREVDHVTRCNSGEVEVDYLRHWVGRRTQFETRPHGRTPVAATR